jgi:hypothetical protein
MADKRNVKDRYYLIKIKEWNLKDLRPVCEIVSCIGEAGNLEAESLRLLKMHDICTDSYEVQTTEELELDPLKGA